MMDAVVCVSVHDGKSLKEACEQIENTTMKRKTKKEITTIFKLIFYVIARSLIPINDHK